MAIYIIYEFVSYTIGGVITSTLKRDKRNQGKFKLNNCNILNMLIIHTINIPRISVNSVCKYIMISMNFYYEGSL